MPHDIIDNSDQKLAAPINRIFGSTEFARFAVGYFFLSGLEAIEEKLGSPSWKSPSNSRSPQPSRNSSTQFAATPLPDATSSKPSPASTTTTA